MPPAVVLPSLKVIAPVPVAVAVKTAIWPSVRVVTVGELVATMSLVPV